MSKFKVRFLSCLTSQCSRANQMQVFLSLLRETGKCIVYTSYLCLGQGPMFSTQWWNICKFSINLCPQRTVLQKLVCMICLWKWALLCFVLKEYAAMYLVLFANRTAGLNIMWNISNIRWDCSLFPHRYDKWGKSQKGFQFWEWPDVPLETLCHKERK